MIWRSNAEQRYPGQRPGGARERAQPSQAALLAQLVDALNELKQLSQRFVRVLNYGEAIAWFVDARPAGGLAQRGALLRSPARGRRIEIVQVFLGERDEVLCDPDGAPIGRRLIVDELDQELRDAFGGTDLIIVE